MSSQTDEFLDLYKQLEQIAVSEYHMPVDGSSVARLERMPEFSEIAPELRYCREVRALLTHNPKLDGSYAVIPSEPMLALLRSLVRQIGSPKSCMEVATPLDKLLTVGPEDRALPVIRKMLENGYSHIPVCFRGCVVGVLNETALLRFSAETGNILDEQTDMRALASYTMLAGQPKKYAFLRADASVHDAETIFSSRFRRGERIAMIFLTDDGKKSGSLRGVITPWDIMGI